MSRQLIKALLDPFYFLASLTPIVSRLLPPCDHFALHAGAPSEGYYTRIITQSGANILLIFSSVFKAKDKPHYVHFSLLRPTEHGARDTGKESVVVDRFPDIQDTLLEKYGDGMQAFKRTATGDGVKGFYKIGKSLQTYRVGIETEDGELEVEVDLKKRTPWEKGNGVSTPEGAFSNLIFLLPLHWDVFSTASEAEVVVRRDGKLLLRETGTAHAEKNWGTEFPKGWAWLQSFDNSKSGATSSFALAGGKILGQKAYLLGYRSPKLAWSFRPLFTLLPFSFNTPFASESHDSKKGTMELQVSSFTKKLSIDVSAPPDHEGFLAMNCPLSDGHGNKYAYESFEGRILVKAYERSWSLTGPSAWRLVEERCFTGAAVEFGGSYSFKVVTES